MDIRHCLEPMRCVLASSKKPLCDRTPADAHVLGKGSVFRVSPACSQAFSTGYTGVQVSSAADGRVQCSVL